MSTLIYYLPSLKTFLPSVFHLNPTKRKPSNPKMKACSLKKVAVIIG
jgi:hypothetical protein